MISQIPNGGKIFILLSILAFISLVNLFSNFIQ